MTEYNASNPKKPEHPDKHFFYAIEENLREQGIAVNTFIDSFIDDIFQNVNITKFVNSLTKMIE